MNVVEASAAQGFHVELECMLGKCMKNPIKLRWSCIEASQPKSDPRHLDGKCVPEPLRHNSKTLQQGCMPLKPCWPNQPVMKDVILFFVLRIKPAGPLVDQGRAVEHFGSYQDKL